MPKKLERKVRYHFSGTLQEWEEGILRPFARIVLDEHMKALRERGLLTTP